MSQQQKQILTAVLAIVKRLAQLMAETSPTTPEAFGAVVKAELAKYGPVVKASGAKVD